MADKISTGVAIGLASGKGIKDIFDDFIINMYSGITVGEYFKIISS